MTQPAMYVPVESKWKHWPTYIYDTNYKYGINFYQPMIDYIDRRGRTSTTSYRDYRSPSRSEMPELPWSDGRLLWGERPVEPYSRRELIQHAVDAEDQAREHLRQFKVANRSDFSLSKTAQASHVTREVFPGRLEATRISPWSLFVQSARVRSEARQLQRKMAEIDLQCLRDMQALTEARTTLDQAKSLRGKSARAIEIQLRAEAIANLNRSQQLADLRKAQLLDEAIFDGRERLWLSRELTRKLDIDEDRLTAPLGCLSRELKGYEKKSANYLLNQRYRDPTRPRRLYGCLG
nr:paramyosin, short form-like [Megalopta genalis]